MTKPARHVAADASREEYAPKKRHGEAGLEVDYYCQASMEDSKKAFATMRPARVVEPFQEKKYAPACNGEVVPERELGKGDVENHAAEKNRRNPDVAGAHEDAEPPFPAGGLLAFSACGVAIILHLLLRYVQVPPLACASVPLACRHRSAGQTLLLRD